MLPLKMIFLKEDGMILKFVWNIQQKVGIEFLSTDKKDFRKIILWMEELVQADNEQLPP